MINLVGSCIVIRTDSSLCADYGKPVDIHYVHGVADGVTLHSAHYFDFAAGLGMHRHLYKSYG